MSDRAGAAGAGAIRFLGVPVERHASIGSTNDEAFRRAEEEAPEGLVVIASVQTEGRGRQGRLWWDAPGASLSFSVLLRPRIPLPQFPLFALAMACAVADAGAEAAGTRLDVKWPNDVLHRGRKLCGILAESRVSGAPAAGGTPLVIGVGVNVNQSEEDFPPEIRGAATSFRLAGGGAVLPLDTLLAAVLSRFERLVGLAPGDDADALWREIAPRLPGQGAEVSVRSGGRRIDGIVEGVTETGALKVRERGHDETIVISAGEML
jgi:BirA family biotin operon repressor/biotin-[acetyl-CoA-carboxylase] ligase